MTAAPKYSPLVDRVAEKIKRKHNQGFEAMAQAAIAACHAEELLKVLREYIAAADESVTGDNDVAAMLRFGAADKAARALLAKLDGQP
jgi:hypothetical protein